MGPGMKSVRLPLTTLLALHAVIKHVMHARAGI